MERDGRCISSLCQAPENKRPYPPASSQWVAFVSSLKSYIWKTRNKPISGRYLRPDISKVNSKAETLPRRERKGERTAEIEGCRLRNDQIPVNQGQDGSNTHTYASLGFPSLPPQSNAIRFPQSSTGQEN